MRIGIISNIDKDPGYEFAVDVARKVVQKSAVAVVDNAYLGTPLGNSQYTEVAEYASCDLIFCIGGDGTFLSTVHNHFLKDVPIIGINLGSIGFLAEISPEQFDDALDRILNQRFQIENRMQLEISVISHDGELKGTGICLNDVVVARGFLLHVLTLDLFIDGDYVERLSGDGVIMSTPTGSTAYSLAAGGPIVKPELNIFLVTPICPHTLHNRSYVVTQDSVVEIRLKNFKEQPILSFDGRNEIPLSPLDRVIVKKSSHPMKMARLGYTHFYQTVRQKIRARGSFYEDSQE
ncbi:MAG: NAD(+)/NADH kinase [Clostridiaceae bacterium]|nr:NAD(+)/NADH kinase [Clostridiaceae bacterium]